VKTMNPLNAAIQMLEKTKGSWVEFQGGRWKVNEELEAVLLQPPGNLPSAFVFHYGAVKLFCSHEAGSGALMSTRLSQVIEPARRWIHAAFMSGVPSGRELIDRERGEMPVTAPRTPPTVKHLPPKLETPAPAPALPTVPTQEIPFMALLDGQTKTKRMQYEVVKYGEIPSGVRWAVPPFNQGQIVEVAYGDFGRAEPGVGDPWMRITDRSEVDGPTYYRRIRKGR